MGGDRAASLIPSVAAEAFKYFHQSKDRGIENSYRFGNED